MAKRSTQYLLPLLIIGGVSFVLAGSVMAAATTAGFGASVLRPVSMGAGRGYALGLFRTHWCGNAKVEYRETCDDGNRRNGDGCSVRCQKEGTKNSCAGHAMGERFLGPDGCNTCTCNAGGMACTKMYCPPKSSSSSVRSGTRTSTTGATKCLSSDQCARGQYCTTDDGVCDSACESGAMVCIQACAGVCRSTQCKPYVCPDGTQHPSCSEDGHVINYFADPCLTHQSSSSRS
ncbi:MAG: hypothetical protein HOO67_01935 [Candidatus Peribacteraceae bacterium]|nr:hypothetical protein [Candidatus Peribacteraceae bacterium]